MKNNDISSLLELVETKFGRGSSANWKNRDFEDLNFEIIKDTKINISVHTLKRVFGKIKTDEYYLPQKATFEALKKYVKFEKNKPQKDEPLTATPVTIPVDKEPKTKAQKITIILATITLTIIGTLLYILLIKPSMQTAMQGTIKLTYTEGRIPKTAEFTYSTPNNKDSFFIAYDENYSPIPVPNGKNLKTNYYYQYPGLFKVRMWSKNNIVSINIPVYVPTNGWETFAHYNNQKQLERFYRIDNHRLTHNNCFSPTKKDMNDSGMDTTKLTDIRLNNYYPTGINGDNFTLKATLKNATIWPSANCNSVYLNVVGRNDYIRLHFANPGCSYWIQCKLSEKKLSKKNKNLSNLTIDMCKWQHFRIENKNKHIKVYINNTERLSETYNESIGEIMGVNIHFQGGGTLKEYRLTSSEGKPIFTYP